jgi:hypothetical protein
MQACCDLHTQRRIHGVGMRNNLINPGPGLFPQVMTWHVGHCILCRAAGVSSAASLNNSFDWLLQVSLMRAFKLS